MALLSSELKISDAAQEFYTEFPEKRDIVFIMDDTKLEESTKNTFDGLDKLAKSLSREASVSENQKRKIMELSKHNWNPRVIPAKESDYNTGQSISAVVIPESSDAHAIIDDILQINYLFKSTSNLALHHFTDSAQFITLEMYQQNTFDHEIGHALLCTSESFPWDNLPNHDRQHVHECVAESYAAIRHYQRYGSDSPFVKDYTNFGELYSLHRFIKRKDKLGGSYYTHPCLENINILNQNNKLKNLSPKESFNLACKVAQEYAPTIADIEKIVQKVDNLLEHTGYKKEKWGSIKRLFGMKAKANPEIPDPDIDLAKHILDLSNKFVPDAVQTSTFLKRLQDLTNNNNYPIIKANPQQHISP